MINSGAVVKLKSGGPAMTVIQADADKNIYCMWFDAHQNVQTGAFKLAMLKREAVEAVASPFRKAA